MWVLVLTRLVTCVSRFTSLGSSLPRKLHGLVERVHICKVLMTGSDM